MSEAGGADVWERTNGTWMDCESAAGLVDSICGEGEGWPALLHRLESDQIGVRAREWGHWLSSDYGPEHLGWRRRVIRGLQALTGRSSYDSGVVVEYANRAAGDFSGKVWVDRAERTIVLWYIHGLQFRREDIIQSFGSAPRGRPKGSGSMEVRDAPRLAAMQELIETGAAKSIRDAACQVASGVEGEAFPTVLERLRKRYPAWAKSGRV